MENYKDALESYTEVCTGDSGEDSTRDLIGIQWWSGKDRVGISKRSSSDLVGIYEFFSRETDKDLSEI